jgi:glycosyltransferase involved in cell wall biosynthesis
LSGKDSETATTTVKTGTDPVTPLDSNAKSYNPLRPPTFRTKAIRMHFVHIEDFFHPDAGYHLNSLAPLQARQGHQITIVTAELQKIPDFLTAFFGRDNIEERDLRFERETGVKVIRLPILGFYSGRCVFGRSIFRAVDDLNPDVAFVHGEDTLTGMTFVWRAARQEYPLVLDCHMLEMASLNRFRSVFRAFFRRFVTPIILRQEIPLIRVVDSDFVEKCLGIPLSYTNLLSFGTDTVKFGPDEETGQRVRQELGLKRDSFVILYVGKLDESKGGKLLSALLKEKFANANGKEIEFLVIGTAADQYGREADAEMAMSANHVVRLPTQRFSDLARYYQCADLALFPKQCSMSFFEAQSCGLPVLFEQNEINNQRLFKDNAFTFRAGDIGDLRAQLQKIAEMPDSAYALCKAAARDFILETYDYVPIAQKFTDVMISAMEKKAMRNRAHSNARLAA